MHEVTAVYDSSHSKNTYFAMAAIGSYDKTEIFLWMTLVVDELKIDCNVLQHPLLLSKQEQCSPVTGWRRGVERIPALEANTSRPGRESIFLIIALKKKPSLHHFHFCNQTSCIIRGNRELCVHKLALTIARGVSESCVWPVLDWDQVQEVLGDCGAWGRLQHALWPWFGIQLKW